jgi:hypothetical protein
MYSTGHVDHDYADEDGFYSCANPMLLLKKNIIKDNKELVILLDRQRKDQAPYVTI